MGASVGLFKGTQETGTPRHRWGCGRPAFWTSNPGFSWSGTAQPRLRYQAASLLADRFMEKAMLYWALMFLLVALVAAVFGFGGIASTAAGIAQILFVVALVLFVLSLFMGFRRRNL
jgi:uncharacterized membrane protein YtjA (UPF0391 family)